MRLILIEMDVYRVSDKEHDKILEMKSAIAEAKPPECDKLHEELGDYLEEAKKKYKFMGATIFNYRY